MLSCWRISRVRTSEPAARRTPRAPTVERSRSTPTTRMSTRAWRRCCWRGAPVIRRRLFLAARLLAAAVFLVTWAYGVTTYSPFAFDMFIRPQLLPELTAFVTWHHLWYWAAYLLAVLSLVPDLMNRRR